MSMSASSYALIGLTAIVGVLSAVLAFAVLRFMNAARDISQASKTSDSPLMAIALQEAVGRLKAQEREAAARTEAVERMHGEILASLSSGLLVVGARGEVRTLNPAGRRLLRVRDDASLSDFRRVIQEPALLSVIDECLTTGTAIVRRTVSLPEESAGPSRLGVTVSPLFDDRRAQIGAVCLFTDLTTVQQLEEQLRLKESLATVGELTAGIAHEFRNGLATIHGYGKLLDPSALPPAYKPYVEGIRAETQSLTEIVTNFLNFARPAQLSLTEVDLGQICGRVADEWRAEAHALGGDIVVRGVFPCVQGDEVLLRQAFSNLVRNAVEACRGEGLAPVVVVESTLETARGLARISVEDNGPGIAPSVRERVFQPFFTMKHSGTGLGLALVQKIVVFHNGRIVVGESPLGGASLVITLPVHSEGKAAAVAPGSVAAL